MDIQAEKLNLITWLTQLNDSSVISEIKALKKESEHDWWDTLSKQQQQDIDEGLKDLKDGKKKSISAVLKKY